MFSHMLQDFWGGRGACAWKYSALNRRVLRSAWLCCLLCHLQYRHFVLDCVVHLHCTF